MKYPKIYMAVLSFMVLTTMALAGTGVVYAETQHDVSVLMKKVESRERKVARLEGRAPAHVTAPAAPGEGNILTTGVEGVHVGGYVSTAYNLNTNGPLPDANGGVFVKGQLIFEKNNLHGNVGYELYNGNESDQSPLQATDCYWGTSDPVLVEKKIFHRRDDKRKSEVIYEPVAGKKREGF